MVTEPVDAHNAPMDFSESLKTVAAGSLNGFNHISHKFREQAAREFQIPPASLPDVGFINDLANPSGTSDRPGPTYLLSDLVKTVNHMLTTSCENQWSIDPNKNLESQLTTDLLQGVRSHLIREVKAVLPDANEAEIERRCISIFDAVFKTMVVQTR